MFNNPLINEESKLKILEREQEARAYQRSSQLGYSDRASARWAFLLILLVIALILTVVLL
jgi:hypothetical protein